MKERFGPLVSQPTQGLGCLCAHKNIRIRLDHLHQGRDSEALDAFVAVLFLSGPQALPQDAAAFVAKTLEHDRFKDVVAQQ